jgi:hypothetical protein
MPLTAAATRSFSLAVCPSAYSRGMDAATVQRVMPAWRRLAGSSQQASRVHDYLQHTLRTLLPDDGDAAAAVRTDAVPAVLVVSEGALLVAEARFEPQGESPDERVVASVRWLPLSPRGVTVSVDDNVYGQTYSGASAHIRSWTFSWADGQTVTFESVVELYNSFASADPGPEHLARTIVAQLGWAVPAESASS